MKTRKTAAFLAGLLLVSILLSACAGFSVEETPANEDFGAGYSVQEHQIRTFDALWGHLQDDYVYFEAEDVDWNSIHDRYRAKISAGLTSEEFIAVLKELESELPSDGLFYQSRAERIEADILDPSKYGGIGAFVGFESDTTPHVVILDVINGSPAELAGLEAHDSILAIDGQPVRLEEGLTVVERIRGPAGSSVSLSVQTPGQSKRVIKLTRAEVVTMPEFKSGVIIGTDYGYMLFPPAGYEGLLEDVLQSLRNLTANRKLTGLILDLRIANSSGGWPLEEMLTLFHNGVIGEFYTRGDSELFRIQGQDILDSQTVPLVVLVGENTSGFAEILAAGLQKGRRATIIGSPTSGVIETISSYYLPDGSHAHIQSTSFRLLNGEDIGLNGIKPDLLIEAGWDEVLPGSDPLIDAAIGMFEANQ